MDSRTSRAQIVARAYLAAFAISLLLVAAVLVVNLVLDWPKVGEVPAYQREGCHDLMEGQPSHCYAP